MLMLSFDSPPPHWWLTPVGANRCAVWLIPLQAFRGFVGRFLPPLRSGFRLFYCFNPGFRDFVAPPRAKGCRPSRDYNFRSLRSPLNYNLRNFGTHVGCFHMCPIYCANKGSPRGRKSCPTTPASEQAPSGSFLLYNQSWLQRNLSSFTLAARASSTVLWAASTSAAVRVFFASR